MCSVGEAPGTCLGTPVLGHSSCGMDLTDGALKSAQKYSLNWRW